MTTEGLLGRLRRLRGLGCLLRLSGIEVSGQAVLHVLLVLLRECGTLGLTLLLRKLVRRKSGGSSRRLVGV